MLMDTLKKHSLFASTSCCPKQMLSNLNDWFSFSRYFFYFKGDTKRVICEVDPLPKLIGRPPAFIV